MRNFKNKSSFIFNYSIQLVFFFYLLLCPSFPRCRFFKILLHFDFSYSPLSSSCFIANGQQQNLYVQIVAGNGTNGFNGDNRPASTAQLNLAGGGGIYEDSNGALYVGDHYNSRLRKIDLQGIIATVAGTGVAGLSGAAGSGTSINIAYPLYTAGDTMGSYLYFTDEYYVWKYQISNGILSRYAGVAPVSQGFSGDGQQATAAQFYATVGISLSTLGLLYICDHGNNRVRVVAANGIVTTFAGSGPDGPAVGSYGGDGGLAVSTSCKLYNPYGVYADTVGSVFVADTSNSRIRKVDSFGLITTFAGGGTGGDGGPATSASLDHAYVVKGDRLGNIYITNACTVRMVNTAGIINTIIGTGTCGITLTFSVATSSLISFVYGLWVNTNFEVYTAESGGLVHKTVHPSPTSQPSSHPSSSYNVEHQNLFLRVVAGNGTNGYNGDNRPATTAQVNLIQAGVYGDSNGVLYIGENSNFRLRKIDLQGIITTIAGTGTVGSSGASGAGTSINIAYPRHIAGDTMGSYLYFSDYYFVWKYQISNGILSRYAGAVLAPGFSGDGQQATAAQFYGTVGISLSTLGLLYISDYGNNRVRVVAVNGIITTFAGSGPDGPAVGGYGGDGGLAVSTSCKLFHPFGVYADTVGSVFIADLENSRVRKVDSFGIIGTFAGGGSGGDGSKGTSASLSSAFDVKGDRLGNLYIANACTVQMVNTAGIINTIIGTGTCGATLTFSAATLSPISFVYGLWVNTNFEVYTAESGGLVHKTVHPSPTSQPSSHPSSSYNVEHQNLFLRVVAGNGTNGYNGDNRPATTAQVNLNEGGICGDSNGVLYIGDNVSSRLRKIDLQGIITTIAGTGVAGSSGASGAGTSINIAYPQHTAGDTMGSYLFFSDYYYVWKYQISNGILSRYAGVAPLSEGFSGDGQQATAAQFFVPVGISLSTLGLLYIADYLNNRVRVVAVNGIVTTFAGSGPDGPAVGSYGGDGGLAVSTSCKLFHPYGVYADTVGSVFIADLGNARLRKVDSFGIIGTFAGGGSGGDGSKGTSASLSSAFDVKGDRLGNIYIANGCKIRMVNTAGIINTIIGTGACAPTLTFSAATSSTLSSVYALWVSSNFNIYFTESAGLIHKSVSVPFPTSQPSRCPSSEPSTQPLSTPSTQPSSRPSSQPYSHPSSQPSSHPSALPSSPPSTQPSSHPSACPFSRPSAQPSSCPSIHPSTAPSSCPSVQPSTTPSSVPSVEPSTAPSSFPSVHPSTAPSSCPSVLPSTAPSPCPSVEPSTAPSSCPSVHPSTVPSSCPSVHPSTVPSSCPSVQPSTVPSSFPSVEPSTVPSCCPSVQPSIAPSSCPSVLPSTAPSPCPSVEPSAAPSSFPSVRPSTVPSSCPSVRPSTVPSSCPSVLPSTAPSSVPSVQPSTAPSSVPSVHPSTLPSCCPSVLPSTEPSCRPSVQPSTSPSSCPSVQPSTVPSSCPSVQPSTSPSCGPIAQPSTAPSSVPTVQPSSVPSSCPGVQPSTEPSCRPSVQPSTSPSSCPSVQPSTVPSPCPSVQPSTSPSCGPGVQPSTAPSSFPSGQPSTAPSSVPTVQPSSVPSSCPGVQPSSAPSCRPSVQPSTAPSSFPSGQPSTVPSSCPSVQPSTAPSSCPSVLPSTAPFSCPIAQPSNAPPSVPSFRPSTEPSSCPTSSPSLLPTCFSTTMVRAPVTNEDGFISLSVLPASPSRRLFRQMNFLLGAGTLVSDSFRDIILSRSPLLSSNSFLLLGTKSYLPVVTDLSSSKHFQGIPLSASGLTKDSLGWRAIAFGGDFNHDHLPELIIGSPLSSKLYIVYSSRTNRDWLNVTDYSVLTGRKETSNGLGWAVSSAGDFDKDGIEDIMISAIYSNKVYLLKGKLALKISQPMNMEDYLASGKASGEENGWVLSIRKDPSILSFGVSVSYIKDYNGDNYDDIVISALGNNGANRIYVVLGGSSFPSLLSAPSSVLLLNDPYSSFSVSRVVTILAPSFSFAGLSVSGVGDINGDGFGDLLIGSIPYNKGYSSQQSYLLYGSRSSSKHIFLSNFTVEGRGCIIKGGGFMVNGIGDINNDGYDDMMITSYNEWQGKVGSYLIVFPNKQQWISNVPSFLPSPSPSSATPTPIPSNRVFPTGLPSSFPSFFSFFPSSSPSFKNISTSTRSPTFVRSSKPSKSPTFSPTLFPTFISTPKPSPVPSVFPTRTLLPSVVPSFTPTTRPPTEKPSFKPSSSAPPSFLPSSYPSLSASSQGRSVPITSGGSYEGGNGEENLLISSTKDVIIKGNQGKKNFIFFASVVDNVTVTILDFKSEDGDVLDFSQLTSHSFIYSYSTNPLMFVISSPVHVRIILSSHSDYDLQAKNLILPSSSVSSSSSSSSTSSFESLTFSTHSLTIVFIIVPLLVLFGFLAFLLNSHGRSAKRKQKEQDQSSNFDQVDKQEEEFDDNLSVTLSDEIEGISISDSFGNSFFNDEFSDDDGDDDYLEHTIVKDRDFPYEDVYDDHQEFDDDDNFSNKFSSGDDLGDGDENDNIHDHSYYG
jgi:hypothetical protein